MEASIRPKSTCTPLASSFGSSWHARSPSLLTMNKEEESSWCISPLQVPYYEMLNEIQILSHVLTGGRLKIDASWDRTMVGLMERCWHQDPHQRPTMREVVVELEDSIIPTQATPLSSSSSSSSSGQHAPAKDAIDDSTKNAVPSSTSSGASLGTLHPKRKKHPS